MESSNNKNFKNNVKESCRKIANEGLGRKKVFTTTPTYRNMSDNGNTSSDDGLQMKPNVNASTVPHITITNEDSSKTTTNNDELKDKNDIKDVDKLTVEDINVGEIKRNISMPTNLKTITDKNTILKENFDNDATINKVFSISSDYIETINKDDTVLNWLTIEKLPNIEHYRQTVQRNINRRPSMGELILGKDLIAQGKSYADLEKQGSESKIIDNGNIVVENGGNRFKKEKVKLNFFKGVYIPSYTNIVGTLLYLRMGFVAGQAGILGGVGIVTFSSFVLAITALSLSGISSNGKHQAGGLYYILSRSLGPHFGGSIGIIFSIANVGMAGLLLVGIAELISDLLVEAGYPLLTNAKINDIRIFGSTLLCLLMLVSYAGPGVNDTLTTIFHSSYYLSFLDWVIGTFFPVNDYQFIRGVTGYSWQTAKANMLPEFRNDNTFITVFGVFFPGFTGMMAGVMFADNLQDPGRDVPLGLFTSLGTTFIMYIIGVIASGATMLRDASGIESPKMDNNSMNWIPPECSFNNTCRYGIMNFYPVAELEAAWRPLVIAGMFGMTISSTITNLDQGPINFYAVCKDSLFPHLKYFAKLGKGDIPRRSYILLSFLTLGLIIYGDLNSINNVVTNLFMASYLLVNYACFDASFVNSPGWRPQFPYYNKWIALFGAILCAICMLLISIWTTGLIIIFFLFTYGYMYYLRPDVNWGDSHQAHLYINALHSLQKLTNTEIHVKNYRPQILLLSGNPASRLPLIDFANSITKGDSLLIAGHVIPYYHNERTYSIMKMLETKMNNFLHNNRIKAFYMPLLNIKLRNGVQNFFQISGLGKLKPNVLILGFKSNWKLVDVKNIEEINDYVGMLRDAFLNNYGVGILRDSDDSFDFSQVLTELDVYKVYNGLHSRRSSSVKDGIANLSSLHTPSKIKTLLEKTLNNPSNDIERKLSTVAKAQKQMIDIFNDEKLFNRIYKSSQNSMINLGFEYSSSEFQLGVNLKDDEKSDINSMPLKKNSHISMSQMVRQVKQNRLSFKRKSDTEISLPDKETIEKINKYRIKPKNPIIDVWWLFDDGGLTLLIPHLLRLPKSYLEGATLRVFTLASSQACTHADEQQMAALLSQFRIECKDVKVIEDISKKPHNSTIKEFETIISKWKVNSNTTEDVEKGFITPTAAHHQKKRTYRELRMRELLLQHSKNSNLIAITLPVPREGIPSSLYMAWLDMLTKDLPPTLMIRDS
uniref:Solute carrier family 12 member 9 n=1 Tax=Strongyloides stercoralis TaxID=6248 RepID=A0A0K0DW58_STRER